jgi:hypothetical protein
MLCPNVRDVRRAWEGLSVGGHARVRLGVAVGAALGVLGLAFQLGQSSSGTDDPRRATPYAALTSVAPEPGDPHAARSDARAVLEGGRGKGTRPTPQASTAQPVLQPDESRPHTHAVDPRTGGLISVAGADDAVPNVDSLGPVHVDPLPAGTSLSDPVDTASLLERADLQASAPADAEPFTVGAAAPVGTPGVRSLSQHVTPSCTGTGTDGNRVQVLYVHEKSTVSRLAQVLPVLRNEVAGVDDVFAVSSEQTGGGRRVRWVHDASCFPVIRDVVVPDGALGADFWGTVTALKNLGYTDPHRKYLTFADANQLCGIGTSYNDAKPTGNYNDGYAASYARVDANCWSTGHSVAAHELTHNLGGVQAGAPHATVNGHCFDESDLMCYADGSPGVVMRQVCASAQEQLLDCNHDDYFNTNPAPGSFLALNWNTARSSFLDSAPVLGSTAPGVVLRASTAAAQTGDTVTLTATSPAAATWRWSTPSACALTPAAGQATLVCPATVTGPVTVTATATDVTTGGVDSGTVTVSLTRAAPPAAVPTVPTAATLGTAFPVKVTATGKAPFTYAWRAGVCTVADPAAASTTVSCPSGAAALDVPVSMLVTQADGQTVTGTRQVRATVPGAAPEATSWTVPRAASGSISSVLRRADGHGVAGRPVTVQVRWQGGTAYVDLARLTTNASGTASVGATYTRAGSFRFVSSTDSAYAGSVSQPVAVKVSTRLTASKPSRHRVVGTLASLAGPKVSGATLVLQRRLPTQVAWTEVARYRTDAYGKAARTVSPGRTTYFRWVYPGDGAHVASTSGRLTVYP